MIFSDFFAMFKFRFRPHVTCHLICIQIGASSLPYLSHPQSAALLSSPNPYLVSHLLFSFPNPMAAETGGLG
jgi:hypothetical protein